MKADDTAIAVLTRKSVDSMLAIGGSGTWKLKRSNALQYDYVVCARNAHHDDSEGNEPHGTGFLVGRLMDIVPAPSKDGRWILQFSEYAEIDLPNAWPKGWRNPVRYTSLSELGIDPTKLKFKPMPLATNDDVAFVAEEDDGSDEEVAGDGAARPLTIAEAKEGLAAKFGVPVAAIEITIKG